MRLHRLEGIFPGERPGKTRARSIVYDAFLRSMGRAKFVRSNHWVIGGDGGDVHLLCALGVQSDHIFVVDHDAAAIQRLRRQFPKCRYFTSDFLDAAWDLSMQGVTFGTVNVDLCSNLYKSVVEKIAATLDLLVEPSTCFSVTMRADREREFAVYEALKEAKRKIPHSALKNAGTLSRAVAMHKLLISSEPLQVNAWSFYPYSSVGRSLRGVPVTTAMAVLLGGGKRLQSPWRTQRFLPEEAEPLHPLITEVLKTERQTSMTENLPALEVHTKEDGQQLAKLMAKADITAAELAKKADVSVATIGNLRTCRLPKRRRNYWARLMKVLTPKPTSAKTATNGKPPRSQRNPEELRAVYQKQHDKAGLSWSEISATVGVPTKSIARFMARQLVQEATMEKLNAGTLHFRGEAKKKPELRVINGGGKAVNLDSFEFELRRVQKVTELYAMARTAEQRQQVAALL